MSKGDDSQLSNTQKSYLANAKELYYQSGAPVTPRAMSGFLASKQFFTSSANASYMLRKLRDKGWLEELAGGGYRPSAVGKGTLPQALFGLATAAEDLAAKSVLASDGQRVLIPMPDYERFVFALAESKKLM